MLWTTLFFNWVWQNAQTAVPHVPGRTPLQKQANKLCVGIVTQKRNTYRVLPMFPERRHETRFSYLCLRKTYTTDVRLLQSLGGGGVGTDQGLQTHLRLRADASISKGNVCKHSMNGTESSRMQRQARLQSARCWASYKHKPTCWTLESGRRDKRVPQLKSIECTPLSLCKK